MNLSTIDELMDGLNRVDPTPAQVSERQEKIVNLRGSAVHIQALLRVYESKEFKIWKEYHRKDGNQLVYNVVHGSTYDPYAAGLAFGKLKIILEYQTEEKDLRDNLRKIMTELEKLQTEEE